MRKVGNLRAAEGGEGENVLGRWFWVSEPGWNSQWQRKAKDFRPVLMSHLNYCLRGTAIVCSNFPPLAWTFSKSQLHAIALHEWNSGKERQGACVCYVGVQRGPWVPFPFWGKFTSSQGGSGWSGDTEQRHTPQRPEKLMRNLMRNKCPGLTRCSCFSPSQ